MGSHRITISLMTKTVLRMENSSGAFVPFAAEGSPGAARLQKSCNSSRAAGSRSGKGCRAWLKGVAVGKRMTLWALEPHLPRHQNNRFTTSVLAQPDVVLNRMTQGSRYLTCNCCISSFRMKFCLHRQSHSPRVQYWSSSPS